MISLYPFYHNYADLWTKIQDVCRLCFCFCTLCFWDADQHNLCILFRNLFEGKYIRNQLYNYLKRICNTHEPAVYLLFVIWFEFSFKFFTYMLEFKEMLLYRLFVGIDILFNGNKVRLQL